MEKNQNRVFAYTLAKTMSNEDITEVSGGAAQMTVHPTMKATLAGPASSTDVSYDANQD